jgi:hypothetical protein
MQLTRIDRWLRERFVYETHVYTLREPEWVPAGVIVEEMPDAPGRRFKHRMIIRQDVQVQKVIEKLKEANQMFTTRVVDREEWYVPFLAPKDKSVTWWLFWFGVAMVGVFFVAKLGLSFWNDPVFRKNAADALKTIKG